MKIYSSKLEDLRRARDEYDADYAKRKAQYDEQRAAYEQAREDVMQPVREYVENMIKNPWLDFEVTVSTTSRYRRMGTAKSACLEVRILCNERRHFDEASALSWNFNVSLDEEGNPIKETGSWSGLQATTEEQMRSLRATVYTLDLLNSVDWASVLNRTLPSWSDYITVSDSRRDRPDFESQIRALELEEFIGKPVALKGSPLESLGYNSRSKSTVWYMIKRETPKKFIVVDITDYYVDQMLASDDFNSKADILNWMSNRSGVQVKKEYLIAALKYPFETMGE